MQHGSYGAFNRILIDEASEFSGWNLLNSRRVRFELNIKNGRTGYFLDGQRGSVCDLEATLLHTIFNPCSTEPLTTHYN